jgi:hypothetical protein
MVRRDGTVLDTPGYDEASGFLYLPDVTVPPVPEQPSADELAAAVELLRGMVDEFTWVGEHDEANYLGLLLTPLLRELCPPPYKLGGIMARQPGSGKTLLASILRDVHGGVFRAEMPHDEAETEKTISSILSCTTAPVVTFDNVSGMLRSSKLAAVLTSRDFAGRILGSTNSVDMVNDRLWTITGNNLNLGGDLVRRTLWVTIDPKVPNPHLRNKFKLDLSTYAREHRGEILHALLVLVRAWVVAGMESERRSSDSYAHWSAVVRGILTHAGVPGEFDHEKSAQQTVGADDEGWGEFLAAVREVMGTKPWAVRDLVARLEWTYTDDWPGKEGGAKEEDSDRRPKPVPLYPGLIEALPGDLHEKFIRYGGTSISRSLGQWLRNRNGRFAGDLVCEPGATDHHRKQKLWVVRKAGES